MNNGYFGTIKQSKPTTFFPFWLIFPTQMVTGLSSFVCRRACGRMFGQADRRSLVAFEMAITSRAGHTRL